MTETFNTTAWLAETALISLSILAAIPILRAILGLALVAVARTLGLQRSWLNRAGLALLPAFLRGLIGASAGLSILTFAPAASATTPVVAIDRVIQIETTSETVEPETAPSVLPSNVITVETGDSLWAIAKQQLELAGAKATNEEIDAAWRLVWKANLQTIGADPSLIHPGQRLTIPQSINHD